MKYSNSSLLRLFALATGFLLLCFTLPGSSQIKTKDIQFEKGQNALKIPFEITDGGHIFLRVRVNDSEPLLFGLDSGLEGSLIDTKQAKALNLKFYGEAKAAGGGEKEVDFSFIRNISFGLPGVKLKLKEAGAIVFDFAPPFAGETVAGLLGYDFMRRFVFEIDYENKIINLYSPQNYRYRGRGESIPIKMLDNNPYLKAKIFFSELAPIEGMFQIDNGADNYIFLNSPFVKSYTLLNSKQETTEASTVGIGGASKIRIGYATSIKIGQTVIKKPAVHFSQAVKGDSASTFGAGAIGGKLLKHFKKVIFDQTRSRLLIESYNQTN